MQPSGLQGDLPVISLAFAVIQLHSSKGLEPIRTNCTADWVRVPEEKFTLNSGVCHHYSQHFTQESNYYLAP